jgi:cytochrome b involved in lipid metabolism
VQSGGATGVYKSGFKTRGGYYTSVNGISSVKECFDACVNDGGCSSFTYNASKGSCALSSRSGAASSSEAQSGGVRFCKDTRSTAGFVSSSNNSNNNNMPTSSSGKQITAADVAQHNSKSSAWTVVNGKVYDLTDFVNAHPGGSNAILRVAGRDGTSSFNGVRAHGSSERAVLQGYYIGDLASGTAGSGTLPAPAGGGGHDDDDDHGEGGHDDDHGEGGRDDEDDD